MMRIITGKARGVRLATLAGDATRPTSERAKEAIFSMLQFHVAGKRVLDLFGGSGQMGLEALSRGAGEAVFVDASADAVGIIKENLKRTRLAACAEVIHGDALGFLLRRSRPFDLVFLDPPYAAKLVPSCLQRLLHEGLLTPGAVVVCETGAPEDVFGGNKDLEQRFSELKNTRYGVAYVRLLLLQGEDAS